MVLIGGAVLFVALGVVSDGFPAARQVAATFGNEGVLTVGVLFVVAAALTETGGMAMISEHVLGLPRSTVDAQLRLMVPVAAVSAFLNNTPVVAMFIPVISDWCKKTGISPSKLFLPLSYAAVLGSCCTLIGTSTNLVVLAMLVDWQKADPSVPVMGMFTLTPVGVPVAILGILYIAIVSPRLLPNRRTFLAQVSDAPPLIHAAYARTAAKCPMMRCLSASLKPDKPA